MNKDFNYGQTCSYERIEGKWYMTWGADFPQDDSGKLLVNDYEATLLEMGYLIGRESNKNTNK